MKQQIPQNSCNRSTVQLLFETPKFRQQQKAVKRLITSNSTTQVPISKTQKICFKQQIGQSRAIVLGGSIAGLLAAKVVTKYFDQVVLVEKDPVYTNQAEVQYLEDGIQINNEERIVGDSYWFSKHRRGTPQRDQSHILLEKGKKIITENFPNFEDLVEEEGGIRMDMATDLLWSINSRPFNIQFKPQTFTSILAHRTILDVALFKAVINSCHNLVVLDRAAVKGLLVEGEDVKGVQLQLNKNINESSENNITKENLKNHENQQFELNLEADFVVDTMGRNSNLYQWMKEKNLVKNDVPSAFSNPHAAYVSQRFENNEKQKFKEILDMPDLTENDTISVLLQQRKNEWLCCFGIYSAHNIPRKMTTDEFFNFAVEKFQNEQFIQFLKESTPISEPVVYSNLTSFRRFFEKVKMPKNLVALGDSVASFNPTYGQGMTYAALGAEQLRTLLEEKVQQNINNFTSNSNNDPIQSQLVNQHLESSRRRFRVAEIQKFDVSNEFYERIKPTTDFCWDVAVAPEWKLPQTEGDKPEEKNYFLGVYFEALKEVARNDRVVQEAFCGAVNMTGKPGRVFEKEVMYRVIAGIILQYLGIRK